jgi:hypothetical protein
MAWRAAVRVRDQALSRRAEPVRHLELRDRAWRPVSAHRQGFGSHLECSAQAGDQLLQLGHRFSLGL